jgi:glycosyltransferase involved in cell wall biosynthesis
MKKTLVISAISLRNGGTLSILQDCLRELSGEQYADLSVYALVKDRRLLPMDNNRITFIEIDGSGSYFKRFFFEFYYFRKLSEKLKPQLWLSLHDITPTVRAEVRAVYCHNPCSFYKFSWRDFFDDPTFGLFVVFYRYLYKINIQKNDYVIVQQNWLRQRFSQLFNLPQSKIIVAHPNNHYPIVPEALAERTVFIYPSFPRVFKNMEAIGEAVALLQAKGVTGYEVILTISGEENRYARRIKKRYQHLSAIRFIGPQPRARIFELYAQSSCLIFPSKLETWGLPISEFKQTGKPMLLADLPYAYETTGTYDQVAFFDPLSPEALAAQMERMIRGEKMSAVRPAAVAAPFSESWAELFEILLRGRKINSFMNDA